MQEVSKDMAFYGKNGGITISGGEPMFHGSKTIELLNEAKKAGLNVCMETCGYFSQEYATKLCDLVDCFLWDIKDTNSERHIEYTGADNGPILENLKRIDALGGKTIMRCIMVNGVNTDNSHLDEIANLYKNLKHSSHVEIFSYHDMGAGKYNSLGKKAESSPYWIVPVEKLKTMQIYLKNLSVKCKITGI